jgi:hypothetical protein
MKQTFKLKNGEVEFDNEKISIKDNAKTQKYIIVLSNCIWILFSLVKLLKYYKTGHNFDLWFGIVLGFTNTFLLIHWQSISVRNEIKLTEVKSMIIKQRFKNRYLEIRLKNNKLRRVNQLKNELALKEFIETCPELKNYVC